MAGIAAAQIGAHLGPGSGPETGQVARHLDRPVRRREKFNGKRQATVGDRRMVLEAEELLDADRQNWLLVLITDRNVGAGRRSEMRRSQFIEPAGVGVRDQPAQRIRQRRRRDFGKRCDAGR